MAEWQWKRWDTVARLSAGKLTMAEAARMLRLIDHWVDSAIELERQERRHPPEKRARKAPAPSKRRPPAR